MCASAPSWPSFVPGSHCFSLAGFPAASFATKRGAV